MAPFFSLSTGACPRGSPFMSNQTALFQAASCPPREGMGSWHRQHCLEAPECGIWAVRWWVGTHSEVLPTQAIDLETTRFFLTSN